MRSSVFLRKHEDATEQSVNTSTAMRTCCHPADPTWDNPASPTNRETATATATQALRHDALPTATSIRLLDVVDSKDGLIRCTLRTVDMDDKQRMPAYAAISYTWGNPITIYESPAPDFTNLEFPEHADQLPFVYRTPGSLGPDGERAVMVDAARLDYYSRYPYVPREEVRWDSGMSRTIQVNGCPIQVHENLFLCLEALLGLRSEHFMQYTSDGSPDQRVHDLLRHPFWVDALCINQGDIVERAAQVQLMGRIFKSAEVVFGWVGERTQLDDIADAALEMVLDFDSTRALSQDPGEQEVSLSSVPGMTVVHWFALFASFQRLWFRRAWIAQELVLAQDIIVLYGQNMKSISLVLAVCAFLEHTGLGHDVVRLGRNFLTGGHVSDVTQHWEKLAGLSAHGALRPTAALSVDPQDGMSFILGYHNVRARLGLCNAGTPLLRKTHEHTTDRLTSASLSITIPEYIAMCDHTIETVTDTEFGIPGIRFHRKPLRLLAVISQFRNLGSTDPRDKIFAFLNLAEDGLGLVPDYSSDVRTVFRKAAEAMMRKTRGLAVLSHVQEPSETRVEGLPSWVPDFSARLGRTPLDQGGNEDNFQAGTGPFSPEEACILFPLDGMLRVNGMRIGTVAISTDLEGDPVIRALKLALKGPAHYPVEPMAWVYGDEARYLKMAPVIRTEALWRTLIADDLTEVGSDDFGSIRGRTALGEGFANWILADILEAREMLVDHIEVGEWVGDRIRGSFCTRMALWSALYDDRQVLGEFDIPDLEGVTADLANKHEEELGNVNVRDDQDGPESPSPRRFRNFVPTAHRLQESFWDSPASQSTADPIAGRYKTTSMRRLTPLDRRKLRSFESLMNKACEGRKLFLTESGLFGLGPKSVGRDAQCQDEIWILAGARVPLILRQEKGGQYRILGEAYVHGEMYGESCYRDDEHLYDMFSNIDLV